MKKSILLLPILFTMSLHAQTPFAQLGSSWSYTQGSCCGPDSNVAVFHALTDTVIDGRTCSKITTSSGWIGCYEFVQYLTISNDSMFYLSEDGSQFQLLFRWDAAPGDTWSTPIGQGTFTDTLDWTVSDTGHVDLDGIALRTLSVSQSSRQSTLFCPLGGTITERLGGNTPFTWIFAACDGETYTGLRCYGDPDISWLNPQYPQCALSSGIQETSKEPAFIISPSPVEAGEPFIVALRPLASNARIRLLDASGRLVLDRKINGTGTFSLPQAGMYLVQLLDNGLPITPQRLIVR